MAKGDLSHVDLTIRDPDVLRGRLYAVFFSDPDGLKLECVHMPKQGQGPE